MIARRSSAFIHTCMLRLRAAIGFVAMITLSFPAVARQLRGNDGIHLVVEQCLFSVLDDDRRDRESCSYC